MVKCSMKIYNTFFCIITDPFTVGPDKVTIEGPPNDTFIYGERNKFLTCRADCSPACSYTWYKDGTQLHWYYNRYWYYGYPRGPKLSFTYTIHTRNTGNYSCEARNGRASDRKTTTLYIRVLGNYYKIVRFSSIKFFSPWGAYALRLFKTCRNFQTRFLGTFLIFHFCSNSSLSVLMHHTVNSA